MRITYPAAGAKSIWIGTFATEDEFDRNVNEHVVKRLNLNAPVESLCEISFESKATGLRELLATKRLLKRL